MKRGVIRTLVRIFSRALLAAMLLLAVAYGLLHTPWGQQHLALAISRIASDRMAGQLDIRGVSGWLPFHPRVDRLALSDASGTEWLVLESVAADMDPRVLTTRRILLDRLSAETVTYRRRPPRPPRSGPRTPFDWDRVPSGIVNALDVGSLEIRSVDDLPVARLAARGSASHRDPERGSGLDVDLAASGLDAAVSIRRDRPNAAWAGGVTLAIDPANPLHQRLKLPADSTWTLEATMDAGRGHIEIASPAWGSAAGPFAWVRTPDGQRIRLAPEVKLVPERVPESLVPYIGLTYTGACTWVRSADKTWSVEDVRVRAGAHEAALEITLPGASQTWAVAFDAELGPVAFREYRIGSASCRGQVGGGDDLAVALEMTPRGLEGVPPDVSAWLGDGPRLTASLRIQGSRGTVSSIELDGAMGSAQAAGTMDLAARGFDLTWAVRATDLAGLPALTDRSRFAPTRPMRAEGRVSSDGPDSEIRGTLRTDPLHFVDGVIEQVEVEYAYQPAGTHPLQVTARVTGVTTEFAACDRAEGSYEAGRVHLSAPEIRVGGAVLEVAGTADRETIDFRLRLGETALDTLPFETRLRGTVSGEARLGGTREQPVATATIAVSGLRADEDGDGGLDPLRGRAEIGVSNGLMRASAHLENDEADRIDLVTELPVTFQLAPWTARPTPGGHGRIGLRGRLDLDVLHSFPILAEQRLAGVLELDLTAEGSPDAPVFGGSAHIRNARYEHLLLGTDLRDLDLRMDAEGDVLTLTSLRAADPLGGSLRGGGQIRLQPKLHFPFQFDLALNRTRLVANDLLTLQADGKLTLEGSAQRMKAGGALTVSPATLRIPSTLPVPPARYTLVDPERPTPAPVAARPARAGSGITLDVRLEAPNRLAVVGRGLDSEWTGSVTIRGTAATPKITGQLQSRRGRFNFFGRRLSLVDSTIRFTGGWPPRPALDIRFERGLSDGIATLRVGGTSAEPDITLTSAPPLPTDELLPQVLFGKSIGEVTPLQALRVAQAAQSMRGGSTAFDFVGTAQRLLAVDQLDVAPADGPEGGTTVTAGKYLSDRVYIEGRNRSGSAETQLSMEVELTPRISLETDIGAEMNRGVGIRFKRHF